MEKEVTKKCLDFLILVLKITKYEYLKNKAVMDKEYQEGADLRDVEREYKKQLEKDFPNLVESLPSLEDIEKVRDELNNI